MKTPTQATVKSVNRDNVSLSYLYRLPHRYLRPWNMLYCLKRNALHLRVRQLRSYIFQRRGRLDLPYRIANGVPDVVFLADLKQEAGSGAFIGEQRLNSGLRVELVCVFGEVLRSFVQVARVSGPARWNFKARLVTVSFNVEFPSQADAGS